MPFPLSKMMLLVLFSTLITVSCGQSADTKEKEEKPINQYEEEIEQNALEEIPDSSLN